MSDLTLPRARPAASPPAGVPAQVAAIGVFCAATAAFLGLPVIVGQLAELRGLTPEQLGQVASAETLGIAVTSLGGAWAVRHLSPQRLMAGGLMLLALLQGLSAMAWSFPVFLALRLATSVAAGIAAPAAIGILGRAADPDRAFSSLVSVQIVLSAVELVAFGPLARDFGMWGLYGVMGLFSAITAVAATGVRLPAGRMDTRPDGDTPPRRLSAATRALVLAVLCFFSAIGAYWAFIERAGVQTGMSADELGGWLAASNAPALFGSLSAPWFMRRFGERRVMLVGLALAVAAPLGLLWPSGGRTGYLLDLTVFIVLWNLLMVAQMAVLGRWDPTGRAVSLTPAAQGFGLALAPLAAGALAERHGFVVAVASASVFALAGLIATLVALRRRP